MKIEIRRNYVLVDGKEIPTNKIFSYSTWNKNKESYLDIRQSNKFKQVDEIEFINKSGRHIFIVGVNDWFATLKNSEGIKAHKGVMQYMSQYYVK